MLMAAVDHFPPDECDEGVTGRCLKKAQAVTVASVKSCH